MLLTMLKGYRRVLSEWKKNKYKKTPTKLKGYGYGGYGTFDDNDGDYGDYMHQVSTEFFRRHGHRNDRRSERMFDTYMAEMGYRWEDGDVQMERDQNGRVRYNIDRTFLDRLERFDRDYEDGYDRW